jgi:hypothetical protein
MTKTNPAEPLRDEQTARFRTIMDGDNEDEPKRPLPEPHRSVMDRLPRAAKLASPPSEPAAQLPAADASAEHPHPKAEAGRKSRTERFASAYWTVTGTISLIINVILISLILILAIQVRKMNTELIMLKSLASLPLETVRGLYTNFEKMNSAHIVTTIPYDTEIPVQFDIQINQQTEVVLSQDTPINGARVTLTTGGLEISGAPANIVLPAGTRLPIMLTLTVPVDKKVPVHLVVPVDINLALTDLGIPFTGLMDVLDPLYCMLDKAAVDAQGISICEKAKTP